MISFSSWLFSSTDQFWRYEKLTVNQYMLMTSVPVIFLENVHIRIGDSTERPVGDVYFYT